MAIMMSEDGISIDFEWGELITIPLQQVSLQFAPFIPEAWGNQEAGVEIHQLVPGAFLCRTYDQMTAPAGQQYNERYDLVVTRPDLCKVSLDRFPPEMRKKFILAADVRRELDREIAATDRINYVSSLQNIPVRGAYSSPYGPLYCQEMTVLVSPDKFAWVKYAYGRKDVSILYVVIEIFAHVSYM